jgi:hypothetical protein
MTDSYIPNVRSRSTAGGITARAWSTSFSVLDHPSDKRNDPLAVDGSTPIAMSTCDSSIAPLAQDDAADA